MRTQIRLPELLDQPVAVIVDQVLTALLAQGSFAYIIATASNESDYVKCMYNTPDGRHCAAGLAFPDETAIDYADNGVSIQDLAYRMGWVDKYSTTVGDPLATLGWLQNLHDEAARRWERDKQPDDVLTPHWFHTLLRDTALSLGATYGRSTDTFHVITTWLDAHAPAAA